MSHGLQIQGSYTWGKSIDNASGATNGDTFANAFSSPHWDDLRTSRAVSDYNIPRVLVINANWQVPTIKSASGPEAFVANGWELGAIFKANDGYPFTPTFGSDGDPLGLNSTDPWAFPDRLFTPDCKSLINPRSTTNYLKTQCFTVPTAPCPPGTTASTCPFYNGAASNGIGCDPMPPIGPKGAPQAVPFPECFNLAGTSGPERRVWAGPYEPRFFVVQEQLFQENLGDLQHAVPGGNFQHLESPQLCPADGRKVGCLRFKGQPHRDCGSVDRDDN